MFDLALDPVTHDLIKENNTFLMVKDVDQLRQSLSIRLQFVLNEWFLDSAVGIPYFQEIFDKRTGLKRIEDIIKAEINKTPGIVEILEFRSAVNNVTRLLTINFKASTIYGVEAFSEGIFIQ